jgi:hypothetical protein
MSLRGIAIFVFALVLASCMVKRFSTAPQLTGTCSGACDHYIECKSGHLEVDRSKCQTECPNVFGDRDSLMAYESLQCKDAVEYVDGNKQRSSQR